MCGRGVQGEEEEEEEEAEDGPGVADLLAAELVTVVNVLQPLATDIKYV